MSLKSSKPDLTSGQPHEGVDLYFFPSGSAKRTLLLGVSTAEDIRYELGEPMNIYYKEDDRISIHAPSNEDDAALNSCQYHVSMSDQGSRIYRFYELF
jgi:hypothetical protein